MALHSIVALLFPARRTCVFGSALLAAVVATALLSAGEARAVLLNVPADCMALGANRACVGVPPGDTAGVLDTLYTVADTGVGGDPLFALFATETAIILSFTEFVTANALNTTGFDLMGLDGMPDLLPGDLNVRFLGDRTALPGSRPFVSDAAADGSRAVIWNTLNGADPRGGAIAVIPLNFVPEPGTAALLGLGLAGLGVAGRSRGGKRAEGTA